MWIDRTPNVFICYTDCTSNAVLFVTTFSVMNSWRDKCYFKNAICFFCVVGAIGVLVFGIWLFFQPRQQDEGYYPGTVHIGVNPFPGYVALYVAESQDLFEKHGVDVSLERFDNPAEITEAFAKNKDLEGRVNLTYDVVKENHEGIYQTIVLIIDQSAGADALVASEDIQSPKELKDKRIALDVDSFQMYFLHHLLRDTFLSPSDVSIVPSVSPEQSSELLKNREIDAAIVYEPGLSTIVENRFGSVLVSSAEHPYTIIDVLAFRKEFIEQYPKTVQAIISAYFDGYAFLQEHPVEAERILSRELQVDPSEASTQLASVSMYDLQENIRLLRSGFVPDSIYLHLFDIRNYLLRSLKYATFVNTDLLIDPSFLRQELKHRE
ncbi:hypothetical protein COV06_00520 [Candidatus Uhrbacteria bacterium CG10_big_fil_rev_8_21_14_0_10_50_16]|uniref:SsuA/THI5-like domain-containing protein n=1 Tax=Candidatus Uhrbacteria bacterium CG10_big_fil_rev_8_21_14_0_10_50_16 TaxID=1975039 RepID=A0A2H0RMU2_9BACT|nr:MAG: hypothetical protein COV06_00520 [Candidatus Uhrbacteria bacterium CG10_big_fil_rev_8_21_14_0_10_50_16]